MASATDMFDGNARLAIACSLTSFFGTSPGAKPAGFSTMLHHRQLEGIFWKLILSLRGTPMAWIKTVAYDEAQGKLKRLYDRIKGPGNNVDNIMMMHSLRPHTMEGHMAIYKCVLHHAGNTIPKWFLETLGVWVSSLNKCQYCVEHHFCGLQRLLGDDRKAAEIRAAIETRAIDKAPLDDGQKRAMQYARQLTEDPASMENRIVTQLRSAGYSDGEILEINQVTAYFNYANRSVLGLGCSTDGDILGLSPNNSDDPNDWSHA